MEVMHRRSPSLSSSSSSSSTLNPNAPIFIPMASYLTVEDFSDQWWDLVHSSPCFRDYWLHDCFEDPQSDPLFQDDRDDGDLILPDFEAFFDLYCSNKLEEEEKEEEEEGRKNEKELITMAALKWSRSNGRAEPPRSFEKAPKIVKSVRVSPRTINQPR